MLDVSIVPVDQFDQGIDFRFIDLAIADGITIEDLRNAGAEDGFESIIDCRGDETRTLNTHRDFKRNEEWVKDGSNANSRTIQDSDI